MTQIFVFSEKDPVRFLEHSDLPDQITRAICAGRWEDYLGYTAVPTQSWQAMQVGRQVIVFNPPPLENFETLEIKPRSFQVLQMLAAGLTIQQTAYQLHLNPRTVRKNANFLMEKLRAATIPEMTAKAVALKIIIPDLSNIFD